MLVYKLPGFSNNPAEIQTSTGLDSVVPTARPSVALSVLKQGAHYLRRFKVHRKPLDPLISTITRNHYTTDVTLGILPAIGVKDGQTHLHFGPIRIA